MVIAANRIKQEQIGKDATDRQKERTLRTLIDGFAANDTKVALISFSKHASQTWTYESFLNQIRAMAEGLRRQGIKQGDKLVFFAPNSPAWIISALAAIYSGATVVPIDSQQSDEVLVHIIEDSSASWIFTDERGCKRLKKVLPENRQRIVRIDKDDLAESWKKLLSNQPQDFGDEPSPSLKFASANTPLLATDTAVLFYTSGTTGMPKGVPLNHINMLLQLDSISKTGLLQAGDRVLLPLPLFHVYPLNIGLLAPLMMGLIVILPHSLTGPEIVRSINEGDVSVIFAVPRLLRSFFQSISARFHKNMIVGACFELLMAFCQWLDQTFALRPGKLLFAPIRNKFGPSLRLFTCGGAPLEADLASKMRALGWEVTVGYGLTETSPLLTIRMPADRDLSGVGAPIRGVELKIEALKEPDEHIDKDAGEIMARGVNVFAGYRNRPDLNKEAFTCDGWFRTGDLGLIKKGRLHVIGRASSTIVMDGGEKIQPENIEDKIATVHGIAEIALLQVEHKLVALVVPQLKEIAGRNVREAVSSALKAASAELASYLQITSFALTSEALPRTNLGKIKRHELKDRFDKAQLAEKHDSKAKSSSQTAHLNSIDQTLTEEPAAASCLVYLQRKFPEQEITLDTNPQLDLNIDSLDWMNLTLELVEQTGVELSAEAISRVSTVRELLNEIVSSVEEGEASASPLDDPDHYLSKQQKEFLKPLTPWQSAVADYLYRLNRILMRPFQVTTTGYEHLSAKQYVFIPNHTSYIDAFAIAAALPADRLSATQWAGWTGIAFGNPIFSFLSRLARVFPIEPKKSLFATLALGVSVLKAGSNLVWFPEGERTLDGQLLPFKQGIGVLLAKSEVMVVPVYLDGTRESLLPGTFFPRFHPIRVFFGEPIKSAQLIKEGIGQEVPERIATALHARVAALSKLAMNMR